MPLLRALTAVMRAVQPTIVLTHSPQDYMEDHTNVSRLAVTAAFARGIPNFVSRPRRAAWGGACTVYHAMPHGLIDPLRRRVTAGAYVDTTSVQPAKLAALACHESQHRWLQSTQGMNSYLREMEATSRKVGRLSRRFAHAEGWRRHSHLGFCAEGADPLGDALGKKYLINAAYERSLARGRQHEHARGAEVVVVSEEVLGEKPGDEQAAQQRMAILGVLAGLVIRVAVGADVGAIDRRVRRAVRTR